MTPKHRLVSWLLVASLTAALTAVTTVQALRRYHELRTGWSWDLAYYNQWFWSLTQADGQLSVRPVASYAEEGPSVWKMNYLAPIRLALVPFYQDPSRSAHPARDPEHHVLVDHPGGLYAGAIGVEIRGDRGLGSGLGALCALALASGLERFSRTPTGLVVRALGR